MLQNFLERVLIFIKCTLFIIYLSVILMALFLSHQHMATNLISNSEAMIWLDVFLPYALHVWNEGLTTRPLGGYYAISHTIPPCIWAWYTYTFGRKKIMVYMWGKYSIDGAYMGRIILVVGRSLLFFLLVKPIGFGSKFRAQSCWVDFAGPNPDFGILQLFDATKNLPNGGAKW